MTTIAFDGDILAADRLRTDSWGLKDEQKKIFIGKDFLVGGAGSAGLIRAWWNRNYDRTFEEILRGEHVDSENLNLMLVSQDREIYTLDKSAFIRNARVYHAIGSGRDFALAAMSLGKSAKEAIEISANFDVNTNKKIDIIDIDVALRLK